MTLVIITLAGIALLRSVDTGALVAGNLAFKDATMQATSIGMEEAATYLNNTVRTVPNANLPRQLRAGRFVLQPRDLPLLRPRPAGRPERRALH